MRKLALILCLLGGLAAAVFLYGLKGRELVTRNAIAPRAADGAAVDGHKQHEVAVAPELAGSDRRLDVPLADAGSDAKQVTREKPRIRGRVLFPPAAPAERELTVRAEGRREYEVLDSFAPVGSDGVFEFEFPAGLQRVQIELISEHLYLAELPSLDRDALPQELVLEPRLGGRLRVTLGLAPGLRAADLAGRTASLSAMPAMTTGGYDRSVKLSADVSADGRVSFGPLPDVLLERVEFTVPGAPPVQLDPLRVNAGELLDLRVDLERPITLAGRVVDEAGAVLERATVEAAVERADGSWVHTSEDTDADGRFLIQDLPGGACTIYVMSEQHRSAELDLGQIAPGEAHEELMLLLSTRSVLRGRVLWADGEPAVEAFVHVDDPEHETGYALTGEEGRFEILGLPNSVHRVRASCQLRERELDLEGLSPLGRSRVSSNAPYAHSDVLEVLPGAGEVILSLYQGHSLEGVVVDDLGRPLDSFSIWLQEAGFAPWGHSSLEIFESADGSFVVERLPKAQYSLVAGGAGELRSEAVVADVPGPPVRLVVPRGVTLTGRVIDRQGTPVSAAMIFVETRAGPGGGRQWGTWNSTDDAGWFRIVTSSGGIALFATHEDGGCSKKIELELDPDSSPPQALELRLGGVGALEGTLHDRLAERGSRTVRITFLEFGLEETTPIDTEGRFELPLPAGRFEIELEGVPASATIVEIAPGETTRVVLDIP